MQLLYVWIEKYNSIEKQGFNFSSEYYFEIDNPDNPTKITCTKNERYINNFFGAEVNNITAIIGENGTGKSSILNYLKHIFDALSIFMHNHWLIIDNDLLFIFKKGEDIYLWKGKSFKNIAVFGVKNPVNAEIYFRKLHINRKNLNETISLMFYSNVFDYSKQSRYFHGQCDISTNILLGKEQQNVNADDSKLSQIDYFSSSEIKRQMQFLSEYKNDNLLKNYFEYYPKALYVYFSTEEVYKKENIDKILIDSFAKLLRDMSILTRSRQSLNEFKDRQRILFYRGFMAHFINNFYRHTIAGHGDELFQIDKIMEESLLGNNDLIEVSKIIIERLSFEYTNRRTKSKNNFQYSRLKEITDELFDSVEKLINNISEVTEINDDHALFEIELNDFDGFDKFYNSYKSYLGLFKKDKVSDIVRFDWRNMSTGEKAKLNLFSRFHYAKENLEQLDNELVVLIDEGETYYHPQWQKEYINDLIDHIPKILGNKKIQFIIASNSPIIVSDLPKDNTIFLEKIDKKTVVSKLTEHRETFAANIHSLFRDAFFVKDGLFGKFATQKIEDLIELVNDHKNLKANEEYVRKFLPLIGEDVIRNKLQTMMKRTLETDLVRIDKRIETLERELVELKKQKNDSDKKRKS
jgi:predicted ATP-dependent endonuclease of OLD family